MLASSEAIPSITANFMKMFPRIQNYNRITLVSLSLSCGWMLFTLSGCFHSVEEVHLPAQPGVSKQTALQAATPLVAPGAGDWPWWRGINRDNHATGPIPPTTWAEDENIIWKTSVPGRGHSTPILWGEQIFVTTADEQTEELFLIAYDRSSGEKLWQRKIHRGDWPRMHAKNSHASATPACDGHAVYTAFAWDNGIWVTKFDLEGNLLWTSEAGPFLAPHGYGSSPAIYKSYILVQSDNKNGGFIAALDRGTGSIAWRVRRARNDSYGTPVVAHVAGRDQLLTSGQDTVVSYDPANGNELWRCDGPAETTANTMAFRDNTVFASGGYPVQNVMAIRADGSGDVTATKILWQANFKMYVPSALVIEDRLLVVGDSGVAVCYSAVDGSQLWKDRIGGGFSASPVLVEDIVFVPDEKGVMHVFRASGEKREKMAQNFLEAGGMASPVVVGGRIYLRTAHSLYCIGDTSQPQPAGDSTKNATKTSEKLTKPAH
jgi:outer membrane protein assembly factor BamB